MTLHDRMDVKELYWTPFMVISMPGSFGLAVRAGEPPSLCAQEENEGEEDLLDQLASVLTAVLRKYGDAALPFLAELMPALGALLEPGRDPEERRIAICILDDIPGALPRRRAPAGMHVDNALAAASKTGTGTAWLTVLGCFRTISRNVLMLLRGTCQAILLA